MPVRNNIRVEVPKVGYGAVETSQAGVPYFVLTSGILLEAFRYLIKENPVGAHPPMHIPGTRLERFIGLAGSSEKNVSTIDTLLFPVMDEQTTVVVHVDSNDYLELKLGLEKEHRGLHGSAHNHNSVHGYHLNPTPPDIEHHETLERGYGAQLTVIASEDGQFGFWRPSAYEVIVDGQRLPFLVGPNLISNIKHYQLKSSQK